MYAQIYDAKQALDILKDNGYNFTITDCFRAYIARRKEEAKVMQTLIVKVLCVYKAFKQRQWKVSLREA